MNPADEMRTAAKLLRERGAEATPGPWKRPLNVRHKDIVTADLPTDETPHTWKTGYDPDGHRERVTVVKVSKWEPTGQHVRQRSGRDLEWIALMSPDKADFIADVLDDQAGAYEVWVDRENHDVAERIVYRALALARAINGGAL